MAGYDPNQPRDKEGQWTIAGSSDTAAEIAAENEAADARSAKREKLQITELERKRKETEDKISKLRQDLENAKSSGADDFTVEQIETELNQEMRRLRAIEESVLEITVTAARKSAGL